MRGKDLSLDKLHIKMTKPCEHVHVSGRRCDARVGPQRKQQLCDLHSAECADCQSMMAAFQPKNGWRT